MSVIDHHPRIVERHWPSEAATQAAATAWAASPALQHAIVALHGDLGAGKTTLVRHLLRALGVQGRIKSPTYAVVEPYELDDRTPPLQVWHFDFYRFADPREWEDAGFRDIFASPGLKLVEWPQKAAPLLPQPDLEVTLRMDSAESEDSRHVQLAAHSPAGLALIDALEALP
ncbi:tRNA (adenosine(37)-N6)-threonylcarbamoyltransferase complex ATPase subunit type 1 TsaE [Curvibacter sp. CHRR-16]|uniref:tRNA (adenosine(37)-N6)-threonylcarbamoyltransferase complex ATPase subunit type 1 TsaE n=1 Tax=Curvibacter sp. CHRR-16 TaxID=2835872 RepID=UPI001BDA1D72|nr:tRNA (adenosine(37)-N6)-threonylcarbamoyltransferase complex ATPase subunit type 1 TsaE [Curvibacter sp. CHRR-16]MBT0568786.1 tRNA (adenosine(37)-N6)-threonylcarbamoyltransferase complex ATPase subunit type 1 TsaE [Curvibacter sp. CHRR-16]